MIRQQAPRRGIENMAFSVKEIADFREQSRTLKALVEYHTMSFTLLGKIEPERVQAGVVSAEFFDVLGVKPLLGRTFLPGDDAPGAEAVLVLSYDYWMRSLGGDASAVGRVFEMNDRPHTVVGVLPPVPQYPNDNDLYMPTSACPFRSAPSLIANRTGRMMSVFGRLKPGETLDRARSDVAVIADRLRAEYKEAYPEAFGYEASAFSLHDELTRRARPTLLILLGTVGLVLLIACANVANLSLARLARREGEMAVRTALGAGRGRLVRQLLTESTLLALAGGVLGLVVAAASIDLLKSYALRFTPRAAEVRLEPMVLLFTLGVSFVTGAGVGLIPAISRRRDVAAALNESGSRTSTGSSGRRLRSVLVVAQVAASVALLIGAGLMLRSLLKLQQVDPGFNPENVLSARLSLNWSKYTDDQHVRDFYRALFEKLKSHPEVRSAAAGIFLPLASSRPFNQDFLIEGRALSEGEPAPIADRRLASPAYFETIGMSLIRGRFFTEQDDEKAPRVAVINQSMARHQWGGEDPVGRRVSLDRGQNWLTIVGVVSDVRQYGLDRPPADELYEPMAQNPGAGVIFLRTVGEPMRMARALTEAVYAVDPQQPIDRVRTLEQVKSESLASPRTTTLLLGMFAALALVITASGIGGVMALLVSQRTQEIGIRMALGAERATVLGMVLGQGILLVVAGLALGLLGAVLLSRGLSSLLFDVGPADLLTYASVSVAMLAVATLASLTPARRAATVEPIRALRRT